jgi:hypothetical protein
MYKTKPHNLQRLLVTLTQKVDNGFGRRLLGAAEEDERQPLRDPVPGGRPCVSTWLARSDMLDYCGDG